jgi:uncharacterized protein YjbI with pentapeptide repeats
MAEDDGTLTPQPRKSKPWTLREFGGKTVWDWLHLLSALAIPVVLAVVGLWFTAQQDARQQQIENRRAEAERELEEQRAQDEALQAYLDQMSTLMLEKDLRRSEEDSEVRTLARARTLTVLGRLDPSRKTQAMQFLMEAKLVQSIDGKDPIITLSDADLSGADLPFADLSGAKLVRTVLYGTDLAFADLSGADLATANLNNADLTGADLSGALIFFASFKGADLTQANLTNAVTDELREQLEHQAKSLKGATMSER